MWIFFAMTGEKRTLTSSRFAACPRMIWKLSCGKDRRTPGQALATGLSTCPTLSWTSMIQLHNNCDKNQKRKLNESGRWIRLLRFFWWFCGSILFSRYLIPVVFRLVDESEMIGHGVPSIRASKRGVWWRVEKRSQKKGRGRRDEERLGQVGSCWACSLAIRSVTSWCRQVRFFVGSILEFQDVKTTYFRSFQAQFPWVLSETFGIFKTWAKLAKSWNPWSYFAMAGHVEPQWTQKNLKTLQKWTVRWLCRPGHISVVPACVVSHLGTSPNAEGRCS